MSYINEIEYDSYDKIKIVIINNIKHEEQLIRIKNDLLKSKMINSVRRLYSATTIDELIKLLERQLILNKVNIKCLDVFSSIINNSELNVLIENYNKNLKVQGISPMTSYLWTQENIYAKQRLQALTLKEEEQIKSKVKEQLLNDTREAEVESEIPSQYPDFEYRNLRQSTEIPIQYIYKAEKYEGTAKSKIFKMISLELGRTWRNFGRALDFRDSEIDALEVKHPNNLISQIYTMMTLFDDKIIDRPEAIEKICTGLDSVRRKDVRKEVEKILR